MHTSGLQQFSRLGLSADDCARSEFRALLSPEPTDDEVSAALQAWAEINRSESRVRAELSVGDAVLVVAAMRSHMQVAYRALRVKGKAFETGLADAALGAARKLFDVGRDRGGDVEFDTMINCMVEARNEFWFALNSRLLSEREKTEALGKYGVAVAFCARWQQVGTATLRRATLCLEASIRRGNDGQQAQRYLAALKSEMFSMTGDPAFLDEAIELAKSSGGSLSVAEIYLAKGAKCSEEGNDKAAKRNFLQSRSWCERWESESKAKSGVEFAQHFLVNLLANHGMISELPLKARQLRFPSGFLSELPTLDATAFKAVFELLEDPLRRFHLDLLVEGKPPNLVMDNILLSLYRESLKRHEGSDDIRAGSLVTIAEEGAKRGGAYQRWLLADAMRIEAQAIGKANLALQAAEEASPLVTDATLGPLARVTIARSLQLAEYLDAKGNFGAAALDAWKEAAESVLSHDHFRRSDLGGRNSVFAVEDARGDLSTTLVFKPVRNLLAAKNEQEQLRTIQSEIERIGAGNRFSVPDSLAFFETTDGSAIHVVERRMGILLSELPKEAGAQKLKSCIELLAICHRSLGAPAIGQSGWAPIKDVLKQWGKTIFRGDQGALENFINDMRLSYPDDVPLFRKRDAHPANWMVSPGDQLVAIDFEGRKFLPMGYEVAQLIEDGALLPPNQEGFAERYELLREYTRLVDHEIDSDRIRHIYEWSCVSRALWLSTFAQTSKYRHRHAVTLCSRLAATAIDSNIRNGAAGLARALNVTDQSPPVPALTHEQIRLSRAMSRFLRHRAPEVMKSLDESGFVTVSELAAVLGKTSADVARVASHPGDPRFDIEGDRIRALYGHSFEVKNLSETRVRTPERLFHGTSWDSIRAIASDGLKPISRRRVHLTNNPIEAIEVAGRHGQPLVLEVLPSGAEELRAAADAIWDAARVLPASLSILNEVAEFSGLPGWLTELSS